MLLTDEAIRGLGLVTYNENGDISDVDIEGIAKAQLKKVVEILEKKNKLNALKSVLKAGHTGFISQGLYLNSESWQSLLEEVKDGNNI